MLAAGVRPPRPTSLVPVPARAWACGASVGGGRYGERGPAGDETMVGAAYGAGRAAHARGGEPPGGGRAGDAVTRQADGGPGSTAAGSTTVGSTMSGMDGDAADDDRVGAGRVSAGSANAGRAGGGRRGAPARRAPRQGSAARPGPGPPEQAGRAGQRGAAGKPARTAGWSRRTWRTRRAGAARRRPRGWPRQARGPTGTAARARAGTTRACSTCRLVPPGELRTGDPRPVTRRAGGWARRPAYGRPRAPGRIRMTTISIRPSPAGA